MYSPTAIDMAPAIRPAKPAVITALRDELAAATPITRLAVETMPSLLAAHRGPQPAHPIAAVLLMHMLTDHQA